jgi:hypothetical protein
MAFSANISYDQGTSFQPNWTVFADPSMSIQANLDGFTAAMNVSLSYDQSSDVIASYSTANGNMTIDTANSIITANIAPGDFAVVPFPPGEDASSTDLAYDTKITAANGAVYRIAQGTFTVNKALT